MRWITTAVLAALVTLAGTPALSAQEGPAGPGADAPRSGPDGDRPGREERRAEVERRMRAVRIAMLTEELDLDEKTAIKLAPRLAAWDEAQKRRGERIRTIHQDLKQLLTDPEANELKLDAKIEEFWDLEETSQKERRKAFEEIADVLTTEQQAKLMLFIPKFRHQMRRLIHEGGWNKRGDRPRHDGPPRPDDEAPSDSWWAHPED